MSSFVRWSWVIAAVLIVVTVVAVGMAAVSSTQSQQTAPSAPVVTGAVAAKAAGVARQYVGGGIVQQVTRQSGNGATYGVDVAKRNGGQVMVLLDGRYRVLGVDAIPVSDGGD